LRGEALRWRQDRLAVLNRADWALLLAAARRIPQEAARLRAGGWQSTLGTGLRGRTLGIWGYGKIGQVVAGYGRAFGMTVLAWGRAGSLARARADGFETAANAEDLLALGRAVAACQIPTPAA
jgi:D-3-phosphoglycerate dehydrogenase